MVEIVNKLIRTSRQLVQALGREPTSAEIAKHLDIPAAKVLKIMQVPTSLESMRPSKHRIDGRGRFC